VAGWVALLRGINVGGNNPVPMAELRARCESLDLTEVRSYIASGNVLFLSDEKDRTALSKRLEQAIDETFGVPATVVLRTFAEIAKVAAARPFGDDTSQAYVAFLAAEPSKKAIEELRSLDVEPDRFEVGDTEIFLHYPNGVQGSRLTGALLERRLGIAATARNWRTVTRLAELAG
jgi:uncharacterized protein (DUF1697 family)